MADDTELRPELTELENAWWRDLRDRDWELARRYMRHDFSITTAGWIDAPLEADAWLDSLAGRYRLDDFDDEVSARRYGDVARVHLRPGDQDRGHDHDLVVCRASGRAPGSHASRLAAASHSSRPSIGSS